MRPNDLASVPAPDPQLGQTLSGEHHRGVVVTLSCCPIEHLGTDLLIQPDKLGHNSNGQKMSEIAHGVKALAGRQFRNFFLCKSLETWP